MSGFRCRGRTSAGRTHSTLHPCGRTMKRSTLPFLYKSFLALTLAVAVVACSEDEGEVTSLTLPELGACAATLQVSDSLELVAHHFATGVQIYRWNDTT